MADNDREAAPRDDDTRTWIGQPPPEPADIRTWNGLAREIDDDESWSTGDRIVEKMKAAGWRQPVESPQHWPGINNTICGLCGKRWPCARFGTCGG